MGLGYCDEEYTAAVKAQMDKLTHISNLFYNQPSISAGEKLLKYQEWIRCSLLTVVQRRLKGH